MYEYEYPKADITTDVVVFAKDRDNEPVVLLVKRKNPPFEGFYAFPGGFLEVKNETLEDCASRELEEETSLKVEKDKLHFISMYDKPDRDPRGRVITAAYWTWVDTEKMEEIQAGDDAAEVYWKRPKEIYELLAFDHKHILDDAIWMYLHFIY